MFNRSLLQSGVGIGLMLGFVAGCGELLPDIQNDGATTDGTASSAGPTATVGADDTSAGVSAGPATGTSAGTNDTLTTDVTEGTDSTGVPDGCGDGVPMAGELCYVQDQFDLGETFCDIELGDIDGDDLTDLVLLRCGDPSVITIRGSAAGLAPPIFTTTPLADNLQSDSVSEFALGDVMGQELPDLVVPDTTGFITFLNGGGGTFNSGSAHVSVDIYSQVEIASVSGSADGDVIAVLDGGFRVLTGMGNGNYGIGPVYDTLLSGMRIEPTDVDADGSLDMLMTIAKSSESQVQLFLDIGGGFVNAQTLHLPDALAMAHGDLDGDSDMDIVTTIRADGPSDDLQTIIYDSTMDAYAIVEVAVPEIPDAIYMALADLDADGRDDLLTVDGGALTGGLRLARNVGDGAAFDEVETFALPADGAFLRIGDVNADMMPDVVVVTSLGHVFQLLSNP